MWRKRLTPDCVRDLREPEVASYYVNYGWNESSNSSDLLTVEKEDQLYKPFLKNLGDVVYSNSKGLTLKQIAKECGVSRVHLYRVFKGQRNPELLTLHKILAFAGLTLSVVPIEEKQTSEIEKSNSDDTHDDLST